MSRLRSVQKRHELMSEDKPGTDKPTAASVGDAANPTAPPPPPPKSAAPVVKPAATAAAKPAAPAAPPKPAPVAWESELVTGLKRQYGSGIRDASIYLKDKYLVIDKSIIFDVLIRLCDEEQFDYCVDITAVH